ncbi:MAG: hypothetical protein Q7K43_06155 [Candidatus Woesearchaeota archaeon]|nr:hypothetical protein [Candidatus Woesearchaeota archaeon]
MIQQIIKKRKNNPKLKQKSGKMPTHKITPKGDSIKQNTPEKHKSTHQVKKATKLNHKTVLQ